MALKGLKKNGIKILEDFSSRLSIWVATKIGYEKKLTVQTHPNTDQFSKKQQSCSQMFLTSNAVTN